MYVHVDVDEADYATAKALRASYGLDGLMASRASSGAAICGTIHACALQQQQQHRVSISHYARQRRSKEGSLLTFFVPASCNKKYIQSVSHYCLETTLFLQTAKRGL